MTRDQKTAIVHLRMAPQLRDAVQRAAADAGCSMNAYAVQILATATGDPACFRATIDAPHESQRPRQMWRHRLAREDFMRAMSEQVGWKEMRDLVKKYDAEDPGYFLAWQQRREEDPQAGWLTRRRRLRLRCSAVQRFEERVALVTGAGGGIGRATAQRFAAEGAAVMCADINPDAAANAAAAIADDGGRASAVACDVADPASAAAAIASTLDAFGGLNVLANIAGVGAMASTRTLALDDWNRTITVNLTGTFLMCQAALDPLLASGDGAIVNMASVAGLRATPYNAAYCASKGGVVMLTKSLAVEFGRQGLRVNCVCPSMVDTGFLDSMTIPEDADFSLFGRAGSIIARKSEPAEIAGVIAFLASAEAAMITGAAYVVDGGATA